MASDHRQRGGKGKVVQGGRWGSYWVYDINTDLQWTADLAADWVRYTNHILHRYRQGDEVRSSQDKRVLESITGWEGRDILLAPGEPQTPEVIYWEIGNEPEVAVGDVFVGHVMNEATYAERYVAVSEAMLEQDRSIKVGPCLVYPEGSKKYIHALKKADARIDFFSYHPYYGRLQISWGDGEKLAQALRQFKPYLNDHAEAARKLVGYRTELLATEWNPMMWNATGQQQRSMAMALGVVEGIFTFVEDGILAAHFWEGPQNKPAVAAMYRMLQTHLGDWLVFSHAQDNLRIYITRKDKDRDLTIWALNFSNELEHTVNLRITSWPRQIQTMTLRRYGKRSGATTLMDHQGLRWSEAEVTAGPLDPKALSLTLPPASVSVYQLDAK